jgi:hypothetical protein
VSDTDGSVQPRRSKKERASIEDLIETLKAYAKQELVGPLKGAGTWIAFGVAGAFTLGLGLLYVVLGLLRLIQAEWTRSSSGSLSWLAYLLVLVFTVLLLAFTLSRIKKSTLRNEPLPKD